MKKPVNLLPHLFGFIFLLTGILSINTVFAQSDSSPKKRSVIVNFNKKGQQVTRFDSSGAAIDAHDGEIALFNGTYYLYGTSYDCGYEWNTPGAPFCGFKVYSSPDLVNWTDEGFLFDAQTEIWQTRCDGKTYGCYRPHVIYNKKNKEYVLWINVYDNRVGFRVFTSPTPIGPYKEVAEPTLAVNSKAQMGGLNNGDHDLFVDDNDVAYIAYTDWRTRGTIVIDELNADYTSGTGKHVKTVTPGQTEAPCLMRRNDTYYILYSDPNCGYCAGTGTSYRTASSPLGPWSEDIKISTNSCGGQPSFVSVFKLGSETIYLYGSDLWNDAAKNEALANYFWIPLTFDENGDINPIECLKPAVVPIEEKSVAAVPLKDLDCTSGTDGFTTFCDIRNGLQRGQSFVTTRKGTLSAVSFASSKSKHPDAGLTIEIYKASDSYLPIGKALSSNTVPADSIGWSPKFVTVNPNIPVEANTRYVMVVKSASSKGCYSMQFNEYAPYPGGGAVYSANGGSSFFAEKNRTLMFRTFVK